jgi:hypothetical protein
MQVKVRAVMTCARHEITYARTIIEQATRELNVPLTVTLGVYYHQHMQRMFEQCVKDGIEYMITIDSDSLFTSSQLHQLISTAVTKDLDALASFQCKRGSESLLAFKQGVSKVLWSGEPLEVDAAHFGLTCINVAKLEGVAKPWFMCQPDLDGCWEEGRIDADVFFWSQWKKANRKVFVDPSIRIGHCEELVTMHTENFEVKHLYPKQWDEFVASQAKEEESDDSIDQTLEEVSSGETA